MKLELEKNKKLNDIELETNIELKSINSNDILNPVKKKFGGYKENDVNDLINYSKEIQKENSNNKSIIKKKDVLIQDMTTQIEVLNTENTKLKNGVAIKERDSLIKKQKETILNLKNIIKDKDRIINSLEEKVIKIQEKLNNFKEKMFNLCDKVSKAMYHLLGYHNVKDNDIDYEEIEYQANIVNYKYDKEKSNDYDLSL